MANPVRFPGAWHRPLHLNEGRPGSNVMCRRPGRGPKRKLKEREHEVEEVKRGARVAIRRDVTFGELCDYWIANRVPVKRSGKNDQSIIEKHFRPVLETLRLRDLNVRHADRYAVEHTDLDAKTIHNHLTLLTSMLKLAVELGWLVKVPTIRKPRIRLFDSDYSWLRTDDELRRFLVAAQGEGELVFSLYCTAVHTGLRAGELAGLRWEDLDFERRLITVQRSFAGPTKSGDVRHVPILDVLLPVLRAWRLRHPGALVFTNRDGGMLQKSARVFQEVLHRVLEAAQLRPLAPTKRRKHYIVFHDLRHTFASHWMSKGGDLFRLQRILGHKSPTMTNRYAHLAPEAYVTDYARLGAADQFTSKVLPFPQAKAAPGR
ncbi:MAG: site-specific integrase [Myxococcales bacterium]|nr:site-specific integrase [Myxococcales bacterium]